MYEVPLFLSRGEHVSMFGKGFEPLGPTGAPNEQVFVDSHWRKDVSPEQPIFIGRLSPLNLSVVRTLHNLLVLNTQT